MQKNTPNPPHQRFPKILLVIFLFISCVIIACGWYFYSIQKEHAIQTQYDELAAIANLKVDQIAAWRKERQVDGEVIFYSSMFSDYVEHYLRTPDSGTFGKKILQQMKAIMRYGDYSTIYLVDIKGKVRLGVDVEKTLHGDYLSSTVREAIRRKKMVFSDLHLNKLFGGAHIDIIIPILASGTGTSRVIGVVVLQIDPDRSLYPKINAWPTPSPSGETLLVRREGKDVVFLNELRHKKNTALILRLPVDEANLPAALAARGYTGVVDGIDYRNVPVLSAVRQIPETNWFIISKIDKQEILTPVKRQAIYISMISLLMIFVVGTVTGTLWHRERAAHYGLLYASELKRQEEHAQADAALSAEEERYRHLFDNMQEGYAYCRMLYSEDRPYDFIYLKVNQAFETLTGLKNVVGKKVSEVIPGIREADPGLFEIYGRVAKTGTPEKFETYVQALRMWFAISVYRPEPECFVAVFDVITERKRAEEDLHKLLEDLKRSNTELQQFAYIASHDLQEPLRMVSSFMQLLEQRYKGKLDKDADEFIGYAVDGAMRMQRMVNDLLLYSRIGTRGKTFEPVDCNKVLSEALANLKLNIEETGARITAGMLPTVSGDASQLAQVFQNLLTNAIKFRGDKVPEITIHAEQHEQEWRFSVQDNGIGLDPAYAENVFIIFKRLHTMAKYPGSGIGLTICKKIIERHHGRIWVESEPGKGAKFNFTLPVLVEDKPADITVRKE